MRVLLLVLVVGCHPSDMDFAVGGGGHGGGGGTLHVDASPDGSGSGSDITATACVLTDPRDLASCRTSGSAGLTVKLGTATATTADNGTFTIAAPMTTQAVWDVTSTQSTVVESVTGFTGQTRIPVMDAAMLATLEGDNGVSPAAGTGAVLVRVMRGGVPVQGEAARLTPPNDPYGPRYDTASASAWSTSATGAFGAVYLPGATSGTASLTLSAGGMTQATVSGIPITDGGVTFVLAELP